MDFVALTPVDRWGSVRRSVALLLAFSFTFGAVLVPEAWATRYVNPTTGSDPANDCSAAVSPCATITHALTQVTPLEDIQCAAGTYDATGPEVEVFPLALVDQVQIVGAGAGSSTISAPAGTNIFENNDTALQNTTRLTGFTLQHDASGSGENYLDLAVGSATMAPQIDNNEFVGTAADNDTGIYIYDSTTDAGTFTGLIDNNVFTDMYAPVWVYMNQGGTDNFSPTVSNNTFTDCDYPISVTMYTSAEGTVSPQITDNTSTGTTSDDLYIGYYPYYSPGLLFSPTITGNTFGSSTASTGASSNVYIGVSFSSATGAMTFSPTFSGNTMTATDDNVYVAYMSVWSNTADFTFSPTFSNNTFTALGGDNFYATTLYPYYNDGNFTFTPTFSGNTMTAANGSNLYFYYFYASSMTGDFTFDPVVRDNPQMDAADYNFTIKYGYTYGVDGDVSVSPTITGNTMTGASSTAVSLYITTLSVSTSSQVVKVSPTISNNTVNAAGADGVYLFLSYLSYGVFESDLTIAGNSFTGTDDGITLSLEGFSSATGFDGNWLIANNTISNPGSYGIYVSLNTMSVSTSSGTWDFTVSGNTITNAGSDGMYLLPAYSWYSSAEIDQTILIQGNTVTGSATDGIYLYMSDQTGLLSNDVQITDNVLQNNGEDGLDVYSADWYYSSNYTGNAILVSCNTITGNTGNGVFQNGGTATSYDPPADYGGGNLASPGNNTLLNNSGYDFFNDDDDGVSAESNWWGSTVPATIDGNIWDNNDDGTKGTVDYNPFLLAANSPTITGSLVGSVAVDVPPAGPSIGDTFLYTLTVDSSGACGDVELDFACPVPANTTVVGGSVTTTQGVVDSDDPVLVTIGHMAAGDNATVTWQVVVDSGTQVVTQGTLNGTLIGAVLSDDPSQPGTDDPTIMALLAGPGSVLFDQAAYSVLENAGSLTLTVNRIGGVDGAISIDFDTADGTAIAGTDYTANSGTLNWADQDGAAQTIVVTILDNTTVEGSRDFDVLLSNPQGGVTVGSPDTAVVTILDDEAAAAAAIPTVGDWGLTLFIGFMLLAGFMLLRRRSLTATLLVAGLLVAPMGLAASRDSDLEKPDRKNTSVTTVESVEVNGDQVTVRLADGSVVTARDKDLHFRDARGKQWRTEKLTKEQRRAVRDSEQAKAERAVRKNAKLDARDSGKKNVRRKDERRANRLTLKSLPAGQPVLVSVERDRDGTVRKVRVQAVASVEDTQRMIDDRRQRKLERAAKRAVDNN